MSASKRTVEDADENPARRRILDAAFSAFMEKGYAATSTLKIARRARVSNESSTHWWATSRRCWSPA